MCEGGIPSAVPESSLLAFDPLGLAFFDIERGS